MFADRATIIIKSGKGGDGHVSFRREKYVPDGGPDGGDGGRGGDIVFVVDDGLNTLTDYRHRRKFAAQPGEEGGKRNCHGKNGEDLILKVPAGTVIKDAESGKVIADMSGDNRRQVILKGGRGGLGGTLGAKETGEHGARQQHYRETSSHCRPALPMHLGLLGLSAQGVRFGDQIGGKQIQRVMKFFGSHTLKPSFSKYSFSPTRVR